MQSEYSLWPCEPELELLPTLDELGIGFVPSSPPGAGFLTGTITADTKLDDSDFRNAVPRLAAEYREANLALADVVRATGDELGATPAQTVLA